MSMKNSTETIWNRTRYLPACNAVPQPTAPDTVCTGLICPGTGAVRFLLKITSLFSDASLLPGSINRFTRTMIQVARGLVNVIQHSGGGIH
jgi:hypothetical protein